MKLVVHYTSLGINTYLLVWGLKLQVYSVPPSRKPTELHYVQPRAYSTHPRFSAQSRLAQSFETQHEINKFTSNYDEGRKEEKNIDLLLWLLINTECIESEEGQGGTMVRRLCCCYSTQSQWSDSPTRACPTPKNFSNVISSQWIHNQFFIWIVQMIAFDLAYH